MSPGSPRAGLRRRARALRAFAAGLLLALGATACSAHRSVPRSVPQPTVEAAAVRPGAGSAARQPARETDALVAGDAARHARRTDEAVAAYTRAVEADPTSVRAHLRLVSLLLSSGRRSVAREIYAARAASPRATEADRVMAARLATDGSPAAVRTVYVEAAKGSPENPWWRLALAEIDIAAADRAIRQQEEARAAGDRPRAAEAMEDAKSALTRAQSAVENAGRRGPGIAEVDLYRGLLRSLEGDLLPTPSARAAAYRAAAVAFTSATVLDPTSVDAWADLGDALYRADEPERALPALLTAIRLSPSDAGLRANAGLVLRGLERHRESAAQYAEAARLDPQDARVLLDLGDAWVSAGEYEKALEAYALALERDRATVEAFAKQGAVLERLGRLAEARQAYATYLERGGADAADVKRRIERLLVTEGSR